MNTTAFLIAQAEHGPQLHGGILPMILLAVALVAGLGYLVHRRRKDSDRARRTDREPGSDREPGA